MSHFLLKSSDCIFLSVSVKIISMLFQKDKQKFKCPDSTDPNISF